MGSQRLPSLHMVLRDPVAVRSDPRRARSGHDLPLAGHTVPLLRLHSADVHRRLLPTAKQCHPRSQQPTTTTTTTTTIPTAAPIPVALRALLRANKSQPVVARADKPLRVHGDPRPLRASSPPFVAFGRRLDRGGLPLRDRLSAVEERPAHPAGHGLGLPGHRHRAGPRRAGRRHRVLRRLRAVGRRVRGNGRRVGCAVVPEAQTALTDTELGRLPRRLRRPLAGILFLN